MMFQNPSPYTFHKTIKRGCSCSAMKAYSIRLSTLRVDVCNDLLTMAVHSTTYSRAVVTNLFWIWSQNVQAGQPAKDNKTKKYLNINNSI